jgi:hypothetical protein
MNKLLLHDLDDFYAGVLPDVPRDVAVLAALPPVKKCVGCFGCWIRTPGVCAIADRAQGFTAKLGKCEELIVVSRLLFGGPSPEIKAFLDRNIPYLLPYFEVEGGVMRHPRRYPDPLSIRFCYYFLPAKEVGALVLSGSDGEAAGQKLKSVADSYEETRADEAAAALPSAHELDLMRHMAEAIAKNLRTDKVSAEFIGSVTKIRELDI